jgi:hypothetical protein
VGARGSPPLRARPRPGADFPRLTQGRGLTRTVAGAGCRHGIAPLLFPSRVLSRAGLYEAAPAQQEHGYRPSRDASGVKGLPLGKRTSRRKGEL